jgi:hypothetical protein
VTVAQRRFNRQAFLSFLYSNFPLSNLPTQNATVPVLPRDWKISETPSPDGDYNAGAVGRSEAFSQESQTRARRPERPNGHDVGLSVQVW